MATRVEIQTNGRPRLPEEEGAGWEVEELRRIRRGRGEEAARDSRERQKPEGGGGGVGGGRERAPLVKAREEEEERGRAPQARQYGRAAEGPRLCLC
eukprot:933510-Pyramimonas_sp.AAC.1